VAVVATLAGIRFIDPAELERASGQDAILNPPKPEIMAGMS
jgi:hypothetical protein